MANIKIRETINLDSKGKKVTGFTFRTWMQAALVNVALNNADFDASQIQVKCVLFRGSGAAKKRHVIFNESLQPLVVESSMISGLSEFVQPNGGTEIIQNVLQGVATKAVVIIPMQIDLESVIDLQEDDLLQLTVTSKGGEYSADVDTANSFISVDVVEGEGYEIALPQIDVLSVNPNEGTNNYDAGDSVKCIVFVNNDKSDNLASSQVIDNITLMSDKVNISATSDDLLDRNLGYMTRPQFESLGQSRIILMPKEGRLCNNVTLEASFDSSNVNGGENFFVIRRFVGNAGRLETTKKRVTLEAIKDETKLHGRVVSPSLINKSRI